jgi:uncharacterized membrane protein YoaK (UPF0700 family)
LKKHEDTILALIAGYVDTVGFVALFGLFTAHVTGNFVLIGAELAGVGQGMLLKLLAFPSFIIGIALSSVIFKFLERILSAHAASALHLSQGMLLVLFLITGLIATPITNSNASMVLICGVLGTMAMGVQNARGRLLQVSGLPNTVMTGNVTQIVLDAIELIHRGTAGEHGQKVRDRLGSTLTATSSFAIGAICGAMAYVSFSFLAIALPVTMLMLLAWNNGLSKRADSHRGRHRLTIV